MDKKKLFSNELLVRWDEECHCLLVLHPNRSKFPEPLVTIRESTFGDFVDSGVLGQRGLRRVQNTQFGEPLPRQSRR